MIGSPMNPAWVSREEILAALFTRVRAAQFASPIPAGTLGATTFQAGARKFLDADQVALENQPFLAQSESYPEMYEQAGEERPARRILGVRLFCWFRVQSGDASELGTQYATTILEAVEQALKPDLRGGGGGTGRCTLGRLCYWCRIEGSILKIVGDADPQGVVGIPVRILMNTPPTKPPG